MARATATTPLLLLLFLVAATSSTQQTADAARVLPGQEAAESPSPLGGIKLAVPGGDL